MRRRALMSGKSEEYPIQEIGVELAELSVGGYLNIETGEIVEGGGTTRYSQFIPVNPTYVYQMTVYANRDQQICWYGKNQEFIGGRSYRSSAGIPLSDIVPESTWRWIRVSGTTGNGGPVGLHRQA